MADLTDNQRSDATRIVGDTEEYAADVVLDTDGIKKLVVRSDSSISSELRIIQEYDVNEELDDVTYYDIYSEVGVLTISGFSIEFNDKKVWVRLEVDGNEVFDINCEKLKNISNWNNSPQPQTYISWNDGLDVFYFTPNFPMKSTTSIKIQARSKTGQSKDYVGSIIQVG